MADSINKDIQGPDWPLGVIVVTVPGTPVNIMSLVDPTNASDPSTPVTAATPVQYTPRCNQIIFQGFKKNAGVGLVANTGLIYIVRVPVGGPGNRTDYGGMVCALSPGQTFVLDASAPDNNVFSPYRYLVDADNANDSALVTLVIG
ncbi:MAG: hypothetical protein ACREJN_09080 [Nitrospiraceae bacterium]